MVLNAIDPIADFRGSAIQATSACREPDVRSDACAPGNGRGDKSSLLTRTHDARRTRVRRGIIETDDTSSHLPPTGGNGPARRGANGAIPMLATSISGMAMSIAFSTALARLL